MKLSILSKVAKSWQEWVFVVGNLVNVGAIAGTAKALVVLPLLTTLPTTFALLAFTLAFASLRMWVSAGSTVIGAGIWAFLLALSLGVIHSG